MPAVGGTEAVNPLLRAWEIRAALDWNLHGQRWRFAFNRPEVIDRQPTPGTVSIAVSGLIIATGTETARVTITQPDYAPPPQDFIVDADVATLWNRYQGYVLGREPLLSMAYFCMSMLEWRAGDKTKASAKYFVTYESGRQKRIAKEVWDTLGDLVSERGDEANARKLEKGARGFVPLTGTEEAWVRAVIRRLIVRVGEVAFDAQRQWPVLTMTDFPQL